MYKNILRNKKNILENILLHSAGANGKSVGKTKENKIILVSHAVPGDIVDIQVIKNKKNYLEGKVIRFISYSEKRTEAVCRHFGVCGGCKWQELSYEEQLKYKSQEVDENIRRIGKSVDYELLPIIPSEEQYYYRNKLEFSFSNSRWLTADEIKSEEVITDKNALGFHIPGQWSKVLDIEECFLQANPSNKIRQQIKEFAINNDLKFYDFKNQEGFLRTLMLRSNSKGEFMILIQFFEDQAEEREKLLKFIADQFEEIVTILYVINSKSNDTIYDQEVFIYKGNGFLEETIDDLTFHISAKSFFQTNYKQAVKLYSITKDFADLKGDEIVYDLYTGTGTIAQFLAKNVQKVIGIESVPEAIEAAVKNSELNQLKNCYFYCGDMKNILTQEFFEQNGFPEVIITDPPRDGMHKDVIINILNAKPKKIVYISCNSATQARDIELMKDKYILKKIQPVDMFPQTYHIENVALLELRD